MVDGEGAIIYAFAMPKYTLENLAPVVAASRSMNQVLKGLGLKAGGRNYVFIRHQVRRLGIPMDHFTGQGWSRGLKAKDHPFLVKSKFTDDDVFQENSPARGVKLVPRLLRKGLEYKCSECGINEWRGKSLPLHLDHRNGIGDDNRLENLRFLCPNCHQQTETWGSKNTGAYTPKAEGLG